MNTEDFLFLLSLSVIVPVIVGLVRYRKISSSYRPFLLLMFGGFLAECADYLCIKVFRTNAVSSNISVSIEQEAIINTNAAKHHFTNLSFQENVIFAGIKMIAIA